MRYASLSFLAAALFFDLTIPVHALTCLQQSDPLNPLAKVQVDCSPIPSGILSAKQATTKESLVDVVTNSSSSALSFQGLDSPVRAILGESPIPAPTPGTNASNMFDFHVICPSTMSAMSCASANRTMYIAGQLISNVLVLSDQVVVNATLLSFCSVMGVCSEGTDILSLAAAAPARTIPLLDDDGITRLYPQAVVKQFGSLLSSTPQFSAYDINLNINSEASFYYSGDSGGIKSSQSDFLFVVLHEIMHGLGFTSSYEDYFHANATTVTPNVLLTVGGADADVDFGGFIEYAFDRYFAFASGGFITDVVKTMNTLMLQSTANITFKSANDIGTFISSDTPVGQLSTSLTTNFTTAHSTHFCSPQQNSSTLLVLETSIVPFSSGSSISHVAKDLYAGTGDFLMRYISTKGVTLEQTVSQAAANGASDTAIYGAMGPGLRGVLAGIGYRVRGGIPGSANVTTATTATTAATTTSSSTRLELGALAVTSAFLFLVWQT